MSILLSLVNGILGFNDNTGGTNSPSQKLFDWTRKISNLPVNSGTSDYAQVPPNSSLTLFDGIRAMPEAFTAGVSTLGIDQINSQSLYRLNVESGTGKFRSTRTTGLVAASQVTVAINNNSIATFEITSGAGSFSTVQVGDVMRIRGVNTQDTTSFVFAQANSGMWTVLSIDSPTKITVKRPAGEKFIGVPEVVSIGATLTSDQLRIYSNSGLQAGDSFILSGSFSSASFNDYKIQTVTDTSIDFLSSIQIPEQSSVVLASLSDIIFYSSAKKLVYIEADKSTVVNFNSDTSENVLISPIIYGNEQLSGFLNKWGHTYKVVIKNKSQTDVLTVKWIVAE